MYKIFDAAQATQLVRQHNVFTRIFNEIRSSAENGLCEATFNLGMHSGLWEHDQVAFVLIRQVLIEAGFEIKTQIDSSDLQYEFTVHWPAPSAS